MPLDSPFHTEGELKLGGKRYRFGSGGSRGLPSIPYGDWPITPGEIGPKGERIGAIGINHNRIWDPKLGRFRSGIELHSGSSSRCLISEGCVAVDPSQWQDLKKQVLQLDKKGGATMHVGPEGISIQSSSQTPQQAQYASGASQGGSLPPPATGPGSAPKGGYGDVPSGYAYNAEGKLVPYSSMISPEPTPIPGAQIPPENIPFAQPPEMPNNIPEAIPQENIPLMPPPSPPEVPAQQWDVSSFQPIDYTQMSPSQLYGQGYDKQGISIPMNDSSQYFNSVTGQYESLPQTNYAGNFGIGGAAQSSVAPVPTMDLGGFSQSSGMQMFTDPNTGLQYVQTAGGWAPAFSGYTMSPTMNIGGDLSFGGEAAPTSTTSDQSPQANTSANDIANFGGDMSLGAPTLPSANDAFLGIPGDFSTNPAVADFNAATQQFGQGGFGYDAQGNVVPWSQSQQTSPTLYDPLVQGSTGQPGGVPTVQGTIVNPNTGRISVFNPATGSYTQQSGPGGWTNTGYGAGSAFGAGWAGTGGAGFGGYGGLGGSGAPQYWSTSSSSSSDLSHGGFDPTLQGSGPGPLDKAYSLSEAGIKSLDTLKGEAQWNAQQDYLASLPPPLQQYISGYTWQTNPGFGWSGSAQPKSASGPVVNPHGWWAPTYTTDPSLQITTPPPGSPGTTTPVHGKLGKVMVGKSGEVPGMDHGEDEIHALLEPGEVVFNKSQLKGLKVGKGKHLRPDQKRAIREARKAA